MAGIVNGTATTNGGLAWALGSTEYSVGISGSNLAAVTSVDGADSVLALVSNVPKSITIDELFASVPIGTHNHDDRYYTETEIDALLTGYSATGHTHDDRYYTEAEITTLLANYSVTTHNHDAAYAALVHTHDDRYYTESEVDALLTGYTATGHTHVAADVTNFQTSVSLNTNVTANTAARHTQGTDAGLDTGGANACTAAEIRALLDASWATGLHSDLTLDDGTNPHGTTKADVGLGSVENTALSTWAGSTNVTTIGTLGSLDVDDININGSVIKNNAEGWLYLQSNGGVTIDLDRDADTTNVFQVRDGSNGVPLSLTEAGALAVTSLVEVDSAASAQFILDKASAAYISEILFQTAGTNTHSIKMDTDSHLKFLRNNGGWAVDGYIDWSNGSLHWGGGYGSTGVTISSAGAISMDGALTIAGTNPVATWDAPSVLPWNWQVVNSTGDFRVLYSGSVPLLFDTSLNVKLSGGYGSTGVTIDAAGNTSMNGNLITDGTLSVAGGYGSSGFSVDASGNVSADGDILTDGYIRHNTTQAHNYRKTEAVYGDVNNGASADTVTIAPPAGTGLVAAIGIVRLDILAANADSEFSYYLSGTYSCKIDSGGDTVAAVGTPVESDPNNIATVSISEAGNGFLIEISETVSSGVLGYVVSYSVTWCMQ